MATDARSQHHASTTDSQTGETAYAEHHSGTTLVTALLTKKIAIITMALAQYCYFAHVTKTNVL